MRVSTAVHLISGFFMQQVFFAVLLCAGMCSVHLACLSVHDIVMHLVLMLPQLTLCLKC